MLAVKHIYTEDLRIAKALINRDEKITRDFFYRESYPLFKSIFDNYYTDCHSCKEFMDEIYVLVLAPSKTTGKCQMENYRGGSSLRSWLKSVCLFYCYGKFELKNRMPIYEPLSFPSEKNGEIEDNNDRYDSKYGSIEIDFSGMNREDVEKLLSMMPNIRYQNIIRLLHLEHKSHKEVAETLGMTMDNYYNKRILAEKQYKQVCRKEEKHG